MTETWIGKKKVGENFDITNSSGAKDKNTYSGTVLSNSQSYLDPL